jgi:cobalt transporter subunit CbtB
MQIASNPTIVAATPSRWPALIALVLGVVVIYAAGFSAPMALHNVTHDTRHAFGLPCH